VNSSTTTAPLDAAAGAAKAAATATIMPPTNFRIAFVSLVGRLGRAPWSGALVGRLGRVPWSGAGPMSDDDARRQFDKAGGFPSEP
jgi:hypothetical protein